MTLTLDLLFLPVFFFVHLSTCLHLQRPDFKGQNFFDGHQQDPSHALSMEELRLTGFQTSMALEQISGYTLQERVKAFQVGGGRLDIGVRIEWSSGGFIPKGPYGIFVPTGSKVYPICESGLDYSQVAYHVVSKSLQSLQVELPHGAVGGYDPYSFKAGAFVFRQETENKEAFENGLTLPRVHRFGSTLKNWPPEPSDKSALQSARALLDAQYFDKIVKNGGHVLCFNGSLHVTLYRLVERSRKLACPLDNVVVHPVLCPPIPSNSHAYQSLQTSLEELVTVSRG
jgi:hypothetical protein